MSITRLSAADLSSLHLEEESLSTGNLAQAITHDAEALADEEASGPNGEGSLLYRAVPNSIDGGLVLSPGNASLEAYAPLTSFPRHRRDQLRRVDYWLGELPNSPAGDDLLSNLMRIKTKFTALGFNMRMTADEVSTGNAEDLRKPQLGLKRMQRKWGWKKLVKDLLNDYFTKDSMILYWKVDQPGEGDLPPAARSKEELTPGLSDVCALNPADCDWDNSFGNDILKYRIPKDLEMKIRNALTLSQPRRQQALQALIEAGVQEKYIIAVDKGQEFVTLDRQDGDNWIVATTARNNNGLAKPAMRFIFDALESRRFVKDGEFAAGYMMKHFILQATTGESITQGALAGLRNNWAKPKDINQLYNLMKDTGKTQRVATNHTVKFNYIFPPAEMWDEAKYKKAEARIYDFAGVNATVMSGEGSTNAGGYLGIKRMIGEMSDAREVVSQMIYEFFDNPEIREICNLPDDVDVIATFDENVLKEPKQLLDELKFLNQSGAGDPPTTLSELGRDPNTIRDSKLQSLADNDKTKVWEPVFQAPVGQAGQRQVKQDNKGRPPGDGTTQNENTRQQSPRARAT